MIYFVTGSRDADDRHAKKIILPMARSYALAVERRQSWTLWHGDCPTGADAICKAWALEVGLTEGNGIKSFPAKWSRNCDRNCKPNHRRNGGCPSAGPIRNKAMVEALAAEVAAGELYEVRGWVLGESRGTLGCLRYVWDAQLEATVRGLG